MHSPKAGHAINATLMAMLRRNGQRSRIIEQQDVGETVFVDASTRLVGLVAHWARDIFKKAADVRKPRRTGNYDGSYEGSRAEVKSFSSF